MDIYSYLDRDKIRDLLLGHSVTIVGPDRLQLDDGTVLEIVPNEGCGGCSEGHYSIDELNECPNNAIMSVEFEDSDDEVFRVFVYAESTKIKLLEVSGHDNGYYGVGYWIWVTK
jgi:hypothetical protein